jgi:hypothetical protein
MSDNLNTEREVKSVWRAQGTWVPVDGGLVHAYPGARFLRAQVRDARVLVVALDFGPAERPNAEEVEYAVKFVRVNEEIKEPSTLRRSRLLNCYDNLLGSGAEGREPSWLRLVGIPVTPSGLRSGIGLPPV